MPVIVTGPVLTLTVGKTPVGAGDGAVVGRSVAVAVATGERVADPESGDDPGMDVVLGAAPPAPVPLVADPHPPNISSESSDNTATSARR